MEAEGRMSCLSLTHAIVSGFRRSSCVHLMEPPSHRPDKDTLHPYLRTQTYSFLEDLMEIDG